MIAWFARNSVAANLLMVSIIGAGFFAISSSIPTEVFPEFELDTIEIGVDYRGSTPAESEEAIVIKIEEAIQDLEGIKELSSSSAEGAGAVTVQVEKGYAPRDLLDDIKGRVDAINTFPTDAEKPTIRVSQRRGEVITVVLAGDLAEGEMRRYGESVRDEITRLPGVSQAELGAVRRYEIAIEVSEQALRRHGVTLGDVSRVVGGSSLDLPAGAIRTQAGEILLRTKGQGYVGDDFRKIVLMTRDDGTRLTVGDVAVVKDGFEETPLYAEFNGKRCVLITVFRVGDQNAITLADTVKAYMETKRADLPGGVQLDFWNDRSQIVRGRLNTLLNSAQWGALLVVGVLALFLRPMVAFWVSMGVPISFMGAIALMPLFGITFNIFSLFAFILVLGIVVDDAIVTGENIFKHLQRHETGTTAAIEGTQEVAMPVIFGVLTTVVAFVPLLMVEGTRGKIFAQIPMVIIPVLLFSLVESKLILPAHLKHLSTGRKEKVNVFQRFQRFFADGLEWFVDRVYRPALSLAADYRYVTVAVFLGAGIVVGGLVMGSRVAFVYFPRIASETATARLSMPLGTHEDITARHVGTIYQAAEKLREKYRDPSTGVSPIINILSITGGSGLSRSGPGGGGGQTGAAHMGEVSLRLMAAEDRAGGGLDSRQLANEWRDMIGTIPGAKELNFRAEIGRGGDPIDVRLSGQDFAQLSAASERVKEHLATYAGVFDIMDTFQDGKPEIKLKIKPEAELLGLTLNDLAQQARQAFFGAQAQRIQRGRDDVRVMVRYPKVERESLASLEEMRIRTPAGVEVPFSTVADATMGKSFSTIRRVNRNRTISVTADMDKERVDASLVEAGLTDFLDGLMREFHGMSYSIEGEARERAESFSTMFVGMGLILFAIYVLLAIPFKDYVQPLIVMSVIPFGLIGAVLGHLIMGLSLSIMSLFGMLALSGVVVNDSLVMVDFVNKRRQQGMSVDEAVRIAGGDRFRAIMLTSLTTFVGLVPLMFEKSTQAQFLIPMGVSLGFGILFATCVTLFLVPMNYLLLEDLKRFGRAVWDFELGARPKAEPLVR
ncbi:MAG: efflux RND transporter permease subunit [Verrucomicrobiae bacterium]|nr:efflux RND transporter permease subunit [Verrucomicrobiae bacterium]